MCLKILSSPLLNVPLLFIETRHTALIPLQLYCQQRIGHLLSFPMKASSNLMAETNILSIRINNY